MLTYLVNFLKSIQEVRGEDKSKKYSKNSFKLLLKELINVKPNPGHGTKN